MFRVRQAVFAFGVVVTTTTSLSANVGLVSFQPLPGIGESFAWSRVFGVSADGMTVVGQVSDSNGLRGVAWRNGVANVLPVLSTTGQQPINGNGVSADGRVIAGSYQPFSSVVDGCMTFESNGSLLTSPTSPLGNANDISQDGSTIVGAGTRQQRLTAGRFRSGVVQWLTEPTSPITTSTAQACSPDGNTVVGWARVGTGQSVPFVWTESTGMSLIGSPPLPGVLSAQPTCVSTSGVMFGYSFHSGSAVQAWMWQAGQYTALSNGISGMQSNVFACSDDGSVAAGYIITSRTREASIWNEGQPTLLVDLLWDHAGIDISGWTQMYTYGVSGDGRVIAGFGTNPMGQVQGWVATIPSPTCSLAIVAIALSRRSRRRST